MIKFVTSLDWKNLEIEDIEISPFEIYDSEFAEASAKALLHDLSEDSYDYRYEGKDVDFKADIWKFYYKPLQQFVTLTFDDVDPYLAFNNNKRKAQIMTIIKHWSIQNIIEYSPRTALLYLNTLKRCIISSCGFSKNSLNDFILMVNNRALETTNGEIELTEYTALRLIITMYNFHEYYPLKELKPFIAALDEIKLPDFLINSRTIPRSKDVYKFAYYLEHWFDDAITNQNTSELLLYYPVYLWWKLTNIIPIRPGEFCNMSRDCAYQENGNYYIRLPRGKQKNRKKIQIPDTLAISEELFELICNYVEMTDSYGRSDSLISYRSINSAHPHFKKYDMHKVNRGMLHYLINSFYSNIIAAKYGLSVNESDFTSDREEEPPATYDINRRLRPNDTRHIAIVSLMLQGYDKIEIARLAGHTSLSVQYGYYNHVQFWVDSEVQRLSEEFGMRNLDSYSYQHPEAFELIESFQLKLWNLQDSDMKHKLKLGYCSDDDMNCPSSFNPKFSGCYYCNHWRITGDELKLNSSKMKEEINEALDAVKKQTGFLIQLHQRGDLNGYDEVSQDLKYDIKTAAKNLQKEIAQASKLTSLQKILD